MNCAATTPRQARVPRPEPAGGGAGARPRRVSRDGGPWHLPSSVARASSRRRRRRHSLERRSPRRRLGRDPTRRGPGPRTRASPWTNSRAIAAPRRSSAPAATTARASAAVSARRVDGRVFGGRTRSTGFVAISPRFTASATTDRNVARVSATVLADRDLSSSDCHVATCSGRRWPIRTSPSHAVIRSTRSTYLPSDDGRTRTAATVFNHHAANSAIVLDALSAVVDGRRSSVSALVNASARRRSASSRVRPRTRRGRLSPGTR